MTQTLVEDLIAARDLIANPRYWTQGTMSRPAVVEEHDDGSSTWRHPDSFECFPSMGPRPNFITQMCSYGAVAKVLLGETRFHDLPSRRERWVKFGPDAWRRLTYCMDVLDHAATSRDLTVLTSLRPEDRGHERRVESIVTLNDRFPHEVVMDVWDEAITLAKEAQDLVGGWPLHSPARRDEMEDMDRWVADGMPEPAIPSGVLHHHTEFDWSVVKPWINDMPAFTVALNEAFTGHLTGHFTAVSAPTLAEAPHDPETEADPVTGLVSGAAWIDTLMAKPAPAPFVIGGIC